MEINLTFSLYWKLRKIESDALFSHPVLLLSADFIDALMAIQFSE